MESLSNGTGAGERTRPHVVLVGSPGAGHLIPLAELARRLVAHHGFAATLVTFTDNNDLAAGPEALPSSVVVVVLPRIDGLPADTPFDAVLRRSLPDLRTLLRASAGLAALVPDFWCSAALPLAAELGVPGYLFVPTNLSMLAVLRRIEEIHGDGDLPVPPIQLPGGVSLRRAELPPVFGDGNEAAHARLVDVVRRLRRADGVLVNTFYEMEPAVVEEVKQAEFPPVFPVGPLLLSTSHDITGGGSQSAPACLEWLDRQPARSVVYVAFGSGGALSVEQTAELAAGLEASGHRFLWVVRDGHACAFGTGDGNPLAWLPEGFVERTKGMGLAVASWATQVRVLSHPATAAFVSHCGWNSTLESVRSGVPMLAWPLYAEQKLNAVILEESVGVALRVRAREQAGVVSREAIAAAVKEVMEGEKGRAVRRRAQDLRQAAARAWSSCRALEEVAARWKTGLCLDM